jgi:outer membrane protein assembly factor BamE (lipoprotein component of BamABCDE complex)
MIKKSLLVVALSAGLIGCSVHGVRTETGNPINEDNVRRIVNGKTTASDVLGLFGAPTQTTTLGNNEIYIYKNCKVGGAGISVISVGHTGMKERCNSLSITIDKTSGIVQNYNYQKMFDTD